MAVGFLWDAKFCNDIIATGQADMIALGHEMLHNPNWPLHAAAELKADKQRAHWPIEAGWWLEKRERLLTKLNLR